MTGIFVAVVGPSGAGKDSVIRFAQQQLTDEVLFIRRVVTRPSDAGAEDHDSMLPQDFSRARDAGRFALHWEAHGLSYGLPIALEDALRTGKTVVANVSRGIIPALVQRYPQAVVVLVTAHRDVIAERLARRGRETSSSIRQRLDRNIPADCLPANTVELDNSGALEHAGNAFVGLLKGLATVTT